MRSPARPDAARALAYRPARPDEIGDCAGIWRASINDYIVPLGQRAIPNETNPVIRLFAHLQATDPGRFIVATTTATAEGGNPSGHTSDPAAERVVAFASAIVRERLWYLSMLFVLPELQGAGVGRELLAHVLPGDGAMTRATATDSAQAISNALYALHEMTPRMPLLNLVGLPDRPAAFGALPSGIVPRAFEPVVASGAALGQ